MDQIVIGSVGAVISNLYRAVIGQTYEYFQFYSVHCVQYEWLVVNNALFWRTTVFGLDPTVFFSESKALWTYIDVIWD